MKFRATVAQTQPQFRRPAAMKRSRAPDFALVAEWRRRQSQRRLALQVPNDETTKKNSPRLNVKLSEHNIIDNFIIPKEGVLFGYTSLRRRLIRSSPSKYSLLK